MVLNGRRWEKDNDELAPIILQGLVMPLPLQFRENQYPRLETQLKTIDSTLVELKKQNTAGQAVPKPASRFTSEGFNPFGGGEDPADKPMEDKPMTGKPGEKPGEKPEWTPPEHCLIRICDITIEPGKTYEYRFQIRMVNPNYQHPNVVKKDLANDRELKSAWFEVKDESGEPIKVVVPPEAHFYASDYRPAGLSKHQTVVQYQRLAGERQSQTRRA